VVLALVVGAAARFLPWWGVPLVIVGLVVVGKFAAGALIKRFAMGLIQAKSSALRGAAMKLRSVSPVDAPPAEEYWDEEEQRAARAQRYFAVELTITPAQTGGAFQHWEPGELVLTRPGMGIEDDDNEAADVRKVEILEGGSFRDDDGVKAPGPQTLRLTVGVHPGVSKATLRYYFEELGTVDFGAARP
jgi:hypothetical protein